MRIKWLFITILFVFATGSAASWLVMNSKTDTEVDMVALNEVLKKLESHWGQIDQANFSTIKQSFSVIDTHGQVRFQTFEGQSPTINDAIKNTDTITDVVVEGTLVGKLIVLNDDKKVIQQMKRQLIIVLFMTFTMFALLSVIYVLFLNYKVFKPFHKLQSFAVNVARGNLDIPLKMGQNNPFGAFTESFDIMREELALARQSEYEANRSKKELVASLSHDIKTPVASIKAVSELMLLRADDEKVTKQLTTIYSKAEQINLLVSDMFTATLEELNELKVTVTEEESSVLNGIIANVNYDDQISFAPVPACLILTDVSRLQQVFDNILSNSYKYASTSVTILSAIKHTYLEISIMDYGKGIHPDELPLMFNKFYRGNNAEGHSGSGLGLYISEYLMQSMQGDITCHNREDGFSVTLKIKLA